MKKHNICIAAVNIVLATAIWLFLDVNVSAQGQTSMPQNDSWAPQLSTNAPPPGFTTRWDYIKSFANEKDILDARRKGLLNEDEGMLAARALEDKMESKPMDTYGKVVDQNGQPLAGVKVKSHLEIGIGSYEEHDTETDAQGQFHYLGLHGLGLIMHFQKEGYDFDEKLLPERPKYYLPDPDKPLIITMWKQHGAEPMTHKRIDLQIPRNGTSTQFDLLTGKKDVNGDMVVSLTRNPLNINLQDIHNPFNWSVTLAITNGGLEEITNLYPNEAPAEGYQSTITLDFPTNMVGWQSHYEHAYYFKSKDGQVYGRMTIDIRAGGQTPTAPFRAEIYANPAGSRNLEFDPQKQIMR